MTENYRFFDLTSYTEANFAEVISRLARDGVVPQAGNRLSPTFGGGNVSVDTGEAFVQGFWYQNTAALALAVAANATATARQDYVVIKVDRTANTVTAQIKQGTLGGGLPALTQVVGGTWEFPIAMLNTVSSVTTLTDFRTYNPPMIAAGDLVVGGASGAPTRMPQGANSRVFGVDASGVLGYRQLLAGDVPSGLITPAMRSTVPIVRLNYNQSSNVFSGAVANAGVFDLMSAQNFTVGAAGSVMGLSTFGSVYLTNTGASAIAQVFLLIDGGSSGTYYIATGYTPTTANQPSSIAWGAVMFQALSAGTHTITTAITIGVNNTTIYFDPASTQYRTGHMSVAEFV